MAENRSTCSIQAAHAQAAHAQAGPIPAGQGHDHPAHGHAHGHQHGFGHGPGGNGRRLAQVLGLTAGFMVVELLAGYLSGSLALLADAGHMLSDVAALALALWAIWLGQKLPQGGYTYGYKGAEVLAAFVNALGLLLLAVWIVVEAAGRLARPQPLDSAIMVWAALGGLLVNLAALKLLHGHGHGLNMRAVFWHLLGDLLGSVAALGAALAVRLAGWLAADAWAGGAIALLIGASGLKIVYDSGRVLLLAVPPQMDHGQVAGWIKTHPEVVGVCDLHLWGASRQESMLTCHLLVAEGCDRDLLLQKLLTGLRGRFGLVHMTIQLESQSHATCNAPW